MKQDQSYQRRQSGNVFFTLFGAVAVVGILGAGIMSVMRGPLSTMVEVNRIEQAKSEMRVALGILLTDAGDQDTDGLTEPLDPDNTCASATATRGCIPAANGAPKTDPWGEKYAYCAWNNGTDTAAIGNLILAGGTLATNVAVALISAGPDGVFDNTCAADPVYVPSQSAAVGDDIIVSMTYTEAVSGSGGLWNPDDSNVNEPAANIDRHIDLTGAVGGAGFSSPQLRLGAASMLYPTQVELATCNAANDKLVRLNTTSAYSIEVCQNGTGWIPAGSLWLKGAGDDIYYNTGTPQVGIGTGTPDDTLDVVGTAQVTGATVLGSTLDIAGNIFNTGGDVTVGDNLVVTGTSDLQGDVSDSLGDFTIADNAVVTGTSDLQGDVSDSLGDFTIADNAVVTGTSDLQGDVSDSLGDFTIADNAVVTGTSDLQGDISDSLGNVTIADALDVTGVGTFSNNLNVTLNADVDGVMEADDYTWNGNDFTPANCAAGNFNRWTGTGWVCEADGAGAGGGVPAGNDREIQFNNAGAFGASSTFKLLSDGDLLLTGTHTGVASVPATGAGTRMFFDTQMSAFRAGFVGGTQWDDGNIGPYSVAMGNNATASAQEAMAFGRNVTASGTRSVAMGLSATASGVTSTAIGDATVASGDYGVATGRGTVASGMRSTAMGTDVVAGSGTAGDGAGDGSLALGLIDDAVTITTKSQVTGIQSMGIFMGDQDGLVVSADNQMSLLGGKLMIDPAVPATQLATSGTLTVDVEGDIGAINYCDEAGNNCFTAASVAGGSSVLSAITAATAANTIGSGDNAQAWNWTLTSAGKSAFTFGETAAATNGAGAQSVLKAATVAASTAMPLWIENAGAALSFRVDDAAGDTSPFVVDANGHVGIGTAAPALGAAGVNGMNIVNEAEQARIKFDVYSDTFFQTGYINSARARGTQAAPGYPQDGDLLLGISAGGWNGTSMDGSNAARIQIVADGNHGAGGAPGKIVFGVNDGSTNWNGATKKMTLSSYGFLGIGTDTPAVHLDVAGVIRPGYDPTCTATEEGALRYESTGNQLELCDGASWVAVGAGVGGLWTDNTTYITRGSAHVVNDGAALPAALEGAGTRMVWYPNKQAFRAGSVTGTQWDDGNIGTNSMATGYNTTASGARSTATGGNTTASGVQSTAMGGGTVASGDASTAMGGGAIASGNASTAIGRNVVAGSGTAGDGAGDGSLALGLIDNAVTITTKPQVTGIQSMGIFMGDQDGLVVSADNQMSLLGGKLMIDPAVPATQLATSGTLTVDVEGDIGAINYCDEAGNNCFTAASVAGGSSVLSAITAATAANTIGSGDNAQAWNWTLTSAGKSAFTFGETAAATNGAGAQSILKAATVASSTAMPLWIENAGNALSFRVDDAAGDTSPFVIDANGNVGIGTGAPATALHVKGGAGAGQYVSTFEIENSAAEYMLFKNSLGNTAISITSNFNRPTISLNDQNGTNRMDLTSYSDQDAHIHVVTDKDLKSSATQAFGAGLLIENNANTLNKENGIFFNDDGQSAIPAAAVVWYDANGAANNIGGLRFKTNATGASLLSRMTITDAGDVGIGTETPQALLDISGTGAMILPTGTTAQQPGSPVGGMFRYNTDPTPNDVIEYYDAESAAWVQVPTSVAGGAVLSGITAATAANTIGSGDNAQAWNWTLTSAGKSAFTFGETAAATNGVGAQSIVKMATAATSTAMPLWIENAGAALSFRVDDAAGDTTPFVIDAAGQVGIGTAAPTATLDVSAATDAIVLPTGTTAQQPGSPVGGMFRYNTTPTPNDVIEYYDAETSGWIQIPTSVSGNPAGNSGEIQFNNAGAFGASSNLFWDDTNVRLGIGTNAPTAKLNIKPGNGNQNTIVFTNFGDNDLFYVRTKLGWPEEFAIGSQTLGGDYFKIDSNKYLSLISPANRVEVSSNQLWVQSRSVVNSLGNSATLLLRDGPNGNDYGFLRAHYGCPTIADKCVRLYSAFASNTQLVLRDNGRIGMGTVSPAASLDIGSHTDAIVLPTGTTAQQPGSPVGGMFRYNTDPTPNDVIEYYDAETAGWIQIPTSVSGNPAGNDREIQFNNSGSFGTDAAFTLTAAGRLTLPLVATGGIIIAGGNETMTGARDTVLGNNAGVSLTSGNDNVFIGDQAGNAVQNGHLNTFIGQKAGFSNVSSGKNTFIGAESGVNNTAASNTFVGQFSGNANTSGQDNVFVGQNAGASNTTANLNTFIGDAAGNANQTGSKNTFVGSEAGKVNTAGWNTFVGNSAGIANVGGTNNVFLGQAAGLANTSGSQNIFVGMQAGDLTTTGGDNIIIGYNQDAPANNTSNFLNIGGTIYGDVSTDNVRIGGSGAISVFSNLEVNGTLALTLPGGTDAQRPGTPAGGMFRYNTDPTPNDVIEYYDAETAGWIQIPTSVSGNPAGNDREIQFNNAGAFGAYSNFVFTANGDVGIETASPAVTLHVVEMAGQARMQLEGDSSGFASINLITTPDNASRLGQNLTKGWEILGEGDTVGTVAYRGDLFFQRYDAGWYTPFVIDGPTGRLALSGLEPEATALNAPSYDLSFIGNANKTFGVERETAANTAGKSLTINAGGATSGATDKAGGDLVLSSGVATGDGASSILFQTAAESQGAGTTDRTPATSMTLSSGALTIPTGTNVQRPGTPAGGMFRYNTDPTPNDVIEYYDAETAGWIQIPTSVSGNPAGNDREIQFNNSGSFGTDAAFTLTSAGRLTLPAVTTGSAVIAGGNETMTGTEVTIFGVDAGSSLTTVEGTFIGNGAGNATTSGGSNTFIGRLAGNLNTTGSDNVYVGKAAGKDGTTASNNVIVGRSAGVNNTASDNTFVGYQSGQANTSGSGNAFFGQQSGLANTTASNNTFLGAAAGKANTTGGANVYVGTGAAIANTNGSNNTFVGRDAGRLGTTGSNNAFFGYQAGYNATGVQNTFLGTSAGDLTTTGTGNIVIGYNQDAPAATTSNWLNIGGVIKGDMSTGDLTINGTAALTVPVGTTAQRPTATPGMIRYCTSGASCPGGANGFEGYNGGWVNFSMGISDVRLKTGIEALKPEDVLARLSQVQGYSYEFKSSPGKTHYGVIAQELEKVFPELVYSPENPEEMKSVRYMEFTALLLESVKGLKAENDALVSQVAQSHSDFEALRRDVEALKAAQQDRGQTTGPLFMVLLFLAGFAAALGGGYVVCRMRCSSKKA